MLETLKWFNTKELELSTLITVHKAKNQNAPQYLTEKIEYLC